MTKLNWVAKSCGLFLLWATAAMPLHAQTFKKLHSFDVTDGIYPNALIQAINGNLYGTTSLGGTNINGFCPSPNGCGTVFSITPGGKLTTLYNFCSQSNCTDGVGSLGALVQGTDANFYGITVGGGANSNSTCKYELIGCGTVFKITASGTLTTLYSFCSQASCTDGQEPTGGLLLGTDGNFYGTTQYGGANDDGTVFSITPSGTLTSLYSFCSQSDCADGYYPEAALVQGTDGNLYGTTFFGGANMVSCSTGVCGTVFSITPSGTLTTLYSFCQQVNNGVCTDGQGPNGLTQGTDGNFYGTATGRGGSDCVGTCGTVFTITPGGTLTTLYSFLCTQAKGMKISCPQGDFPLAGLTQATDGNFYGTTDIGGAHCYSGCGTLFSITPGGAFTALYSFNQPPAAYPAAGLLQDTNGSFYGTTQQGGKSNGSCGNGCGTIFSLSVGLGPFVSTQPTSGTVGAAVTILGTKLTGATSVTFNGTAAVFRVKSSSEITTTVPTGATTGTVQVNTPTSGTLSSNVPFTVN